MLEGFTIRGGYSTWEGGAGIELTNASPKARSCSIKDNLAGLVSGGGVFVWNGNPLLQDCAFDGDYVHMGKGGAIYVYDQGGVTVQGCSFTNNTSAGSTSGSPEGAGAAIAPWGAGTLTVTDTLFDYNVSRGFYTGGSNGAYAGAIDHFGPGSMTIDRCTFTNNWSNAGGAIYTWKDATITNSVFAWNDAPQFNSTYGGWGGQGGAIGCQSFAGTTVDVVNYVFYANTAEDAGGIGAYGAAALSVANSILLANTDNRGNTGASQVAGAAVTHCCIQNVLVGQPGEDPPDPANFPGSTDLDPQFADAMAGDFRLGPASPCIDAGNNGSITAGVTTDLAGRVRLQDDPNTPDAGSGVAPIVDMGAYELVLPADVDGDGDHDLAGFTGWAACLAGPDAGPVAAGCEPFDLAIDGDVDLADYQTFQRIFQGQEPPFVTPAMVAGSVTYSGAATGTIHITASKVGSSLTYET